MRRVAGPVYSFQLHRVYLGQQRRHHTSAAHRPQLLQVGSNAYHRSLRQFSHCNDHLHEYGIFNLRCLVNHDKIVSPQPSGWGILNHFVRLTANDECAVQRFNIDAVVVRYLLAIAAQKRSSGTQQ